jgi:hypothetical protein
VTLDPVLSLDREWQQLARGVVPARLRLWAEREPALAPFVDPARLVEFVRGSASSAMKDELLRPLVRLAVDDPLAARVVLQVLLPGLKRIAGRALHDLSERDELWELLLAHAWERIRRYPLARRPRHIAANVLLDTLMRTMRELERERRRRRRCDSDAEMPAPAPDQRTDIAAYCSRRSRPERSRSLRRGSSSQRGSSTARWPRSRPRRAWPTTFCASVCSERRGDCCFTSVIRVCLIGAQKDLSLVLG